jgi:dCMP deaminase
MNKYNLSSVNGNLNIITDSSSFTVINNNATFTIKNVADKQKKWDLRYLRLAKHIAEDWSEDPSTKIGAVIVGTDGKVISLGVNGLPTGIKATEERLNNRDLKYKVFLHGEMNAILSADKSLVNATLYTYSFISCSNCAVAVIQSGIKRCVAPPLPEHLKERWQESVSLTEQLYREAGVEFKYYDLGEING